MRRRFARIVTALAGAAALSYFSIGLAAQARPASSSIPELTGVWNNQTEGRCTPNGRTCPFKVEELPPPRHYQELVSEHPSKRLRLSQDPEGPISLRVIDLITPIGRGQRGLIVAAPKTGKTILLEQIGFAIGQFYPEIHLFVLLVDERPEEVTHFRRAVKGQVIDLISGFTLGRSAPL